MSRTPAVWVSQWRVSAASNKGPPVTGSKLSVTSVLHVVSSGRAERARVAALPDQQLDRAQEVLKGLILYQHLTSAPKPQKVAAK